MSGVHFPEDVTDAAKGAERKRSGFGEADLTPNTRALGKEGGTITGTLHTPSSKSWLGIRDQCSRAGGQEIPNSSESPLQLSRRKGHQVKVERKGPLVAPQLDKPFVYLQPHKWAVDILRVSSTGRHLGDRWTQSSSDCALPSSRFPHQVNSCPGEKTRYGQSVWEPLG